METLDARERTTIGGEREREGGREQVSKCTRRVEGKWRGKENTQKGVSERGHEGGRKRDWGSRVSIAHQKTTPRGRGAVYKAVHVRVGGARGARGPRGSLDSLWDYRLCVSRTIAIVIGIPNRRGRTIR